MVRPSARGRRNLIVATPIRHTNRANRGCARPSGLRRRRRSVRAMRVIAGEAHGRRLRAPRGLVTRPATARVRASIFSRLAARTDLNGARVLDLFAGSGSLGLEALSRGASRAVFVDSSRAAATAIRDNLRVLGLEERAEVIVAGVERAIAALGARGECFDLVFVDAPYRDDTSAAVLRALTDGRIAWRGRLRGRAAGRPRAGDFAGGTRGDQLCNPGRSSDRPLPRAGGALAQVAAWHGEQRQGFGTQVRDLPGDV